MASSTISLNSQFSQDHEVWESLKEAISTSSGFARWKLEQTLENKLEPTSIDSQVSSYLRETLETLAY
ncbi:MAG: hypothetical protein F6K10_05535 [Moorea sp. SIO2B7]|nr:hypothetical protein [Moorena sp. SIO2B7]